MMVSKVSAMMRRWFLERWEKSDLSVRIDLHRHHVGGKN
jgi:hypothetical protein